MRIGIFARTYSRPALGGVLDAIVDHGIRLVHFNLACAGLGSLPEALDREVCGSIRGAFAQRNLEMIAVSGTFNAIHPDRGVREAMTRRCAALIRQCRALGTDVVSLCTGTRDARDMWRSHPDNDSPGAWRDLRATLDVLLPVAQEEGVTLGVEPEVANVVSSAPRARRVLDEVRSENLKIILDGANLFTGADPRDMAEVLAEAVDLLGPDLVQVHAKDISATTVKKNQAAGEGRLDWETYFGLLHRTGFDGPVVLHNLSEAQVPASRAFVLNVLRAV